MQDGAPKYFSFTAPAWFDQISGKVECESRAKKNGHREVRIYSDATSFLRKWAKNESTSQHQRHPMNSTKKLEELLSSFRLDLRKTLVSSTLPFVPS